MKTIRPDFTVRVTAMLVVLVFAMSCSPAARQGFATALAAGAAGVTNSAPVQHKIMLFGGEDHKTYLGCLSCAEYATDSVFNQFGNYGSRYSSTSVWNHYSDYGSAYSAWGACNAYASDPPVIVDEDGNYYGRLTLNQYHRQIGDGVRFVDWLRGNVCAG